MPIPGDAHYVSGTNRHSVRLVTGQVVSRATAENMYAQSRGFRNNYERKQGYRAAKQSRNFGQTKAEAKRHGTSERNFTEAAARLQMEYKHAGNNYAHIDKSPGGALAKYLVSIGRRSETSDYTVGDSPKV
jgi:hypothetical protein